MYKLCISALCTVFCLTGAEWKTVKEQLLKPYIEYSDYDPITGIYGLAAADKADMDLALKEAQKIAETEFEVTKVRGGSLKRLWKIDNEEQAIQQAREELASSGNAKAVSRRLGMKLKNLRDLSKVEGMGSNYVPESIDLGPTVRSVAEQSIQEGIRSYAMRPSKASLMAYISSFFIPKFKVGPFMTKYEPQEMMRRRWYSAVSR